MSSPTKLRCGKIAAPTVKIWLTSLDDVDPTPARGVLSADELARADRIVSSRRRRRFIARRWVARTLLAQETGTAAEELVLEQRCQRCGELHPASPLVAAGRRVWWSATSSAGLGALVIGKRRVGIDLERRVERRRREGIARRFFSEGERFAMAGSAVRFLELWTLKEAYLKALGKGLAGGLDALDCARLEPADDGWSSGTEHPGWRFRNLEVDPGFVAALAVEGEPEGVQLRYWAGHSPGA
ncbi:MAG: 4'-phosphopantetheinyl transferase superfamily protein [Solirubrobacterales bacterium]